MKITQEKLKEIIASHGKWLRDEEGGACLGLTNTGALTIFLPRNGFLMVGILFVIRVVKI